MPKRKGKTFPIFNATTRKVLANKSLSQKVKRTAKRVATLDITGDGKQDTIKAINRTFTALTPAHAGRNTILIRAERERFEKAGFETTVRKHARLSNAMDEDWFQVYVN